MSCVIVLFFKQKTAYEMLISGWSSDVCSSDLADYVTTALLPLADVVVDLHSGGKTLEFVPYAACHRLPQDTGLEARCAAAMQAFNAPYSMIMLELDAVGMFDTEAENRGKVFVTSELGGGSATPHTVSVAKRGLRTALHPAGTLDRKRAGQGKRVSVRVDI